MVYYRSLLLGATNRLQECLGDILFLQCGAFEYPSDTVEFAAKLHLLRTEVNQASFCHYGVDFRFPLFCNLLFRLSECVSL